MAAKPHAVELAATFINWVSIMGLTQVLNAANSGLTVTQAGLDIVARNIANVETEGYTKKTLSQQNLHQGDQGLGVHITDIIRDVDAFLQRQLRTETTKQAALDIKSEILARVDQLFGVPGSGTSIDGLFNNFTESLQGLTTSPESFTTRSAVVGDAEVLVQQLHTLSGEIQSLRQLAEDSIADAVSETNDALQQLVTINEQLSHAGGSPPADLLDQRDKFVNRVAEFLEINTQIDSFGRVTIFTGSGNALLDGQPTNLTFDQRGNIGPQSLYDTDDLNRGVGTIQIVAGNGFQIDLIRNGSLNGGKIGGLIELRDSLLVEAQAQLDEFAHGLSLALSNKSIQGTAATSGTQSGFDIDTTDLLPGNTIHLTYTETATSTQRFVTIVRVDDATQLPLSNDFTPDPNDTVIGVSFAGGIGAVATAIDTALGPTLAVNNPSGNLLRFLDDGPPNTTDIDSVTATITSTSTQDDGLQIPLFIDLASTVLPYSNSIDGGSQKLGFSARIAINPSVASNNELLVRHTSSPETPIGSTERPNEILNRLTVNNFVFSPASGIGQTASPYSSSVKAFAQRLVSFQTGQAARVSREQASQSVMTTALEDRFLQATGVNIDTEISDLITLQNSFAANARVVQVTSELMDLLFQL